MPMPRTNARSLVKTFQSLVAEVTVRERKLVTALDRALGKLGYQVVGAYQLARGGEVRRRRRPGRRGRKAVSGGARRTTPGGTKAHRPKRREQPTRGKGARRKGRRTAR